MSFREELQEAGWHLSEEGVETVSENGQIKDVKLLTKKALDCDLRDIGDTAFPEDFVKDPSKLERPIIVQVQKIRNVSAPKANEESSAAPRMLKLTLSDGKSTCTGLEISPISSLSINTPPGTKLMLKSEGLEACHGVLCLNPSILTVLGGKVTHMIEKWELNRSLAKHTRGGIGADGGPPPWIPFGQRLEAQTQDKQFKSLQDAAKQDNVEFEAQRKGAIAEAQRLSGVKKVFGGGTKPLLDANVQKIIDAGFTEEQAENALKYTKNNVDRALRVLHKRDASESRAKDKQKEIEPPKRKGRNKESDEDGVPVKPSGKVSLFDFLEDKLPNVPEKERNSRPNNFTEDRGDRGFNRDRPNSKSTPRSHGPRYDNRNKSDNRGSYSNDHNRDDRKYQPHPPNEKPPRFQRKFEEKNRQQPQYNQPNNMAMPSNSYNNYQNQTHYNNQYPNPPPPRRQELNEKPNLNMRNTNNAMESLASAAAKLNLLGNCHPQQARYPPHDYKPHYVPNPGQEAAPFRRTNDYPKYPESYRRQAHNPGGYAGGGGGGGGGAGTAPRGGFLAGSVLGFQHAAVNEQARAVLGGELAWRVGDRCLALYWEDNNYYEAEVTGVSANTVVVKFCAYGNHEEVLKSNCLPFPSQGGVAMAMARGRRV